MYDKKAGIGSIMIEWLYWRKMPYRAKNINDYWLNG